MPKPIAKPKPGSLKFALRQLEVEQEDLHRLHHKVDALEHLLTSAVQEIKLLSNITLKSERRVANMEVAVNALRIRANQY